MYLGIDLGTSGVKVIIINRHGELLDAASAPLTVNRPQALFSEQDPAQWWSALNMAMQQLSEGPHLAQVCSIGLSGQMHGATMLDENDQAVYPAILWNDGRSQAQCVALEASVKNSRDITGNIMMPGFTAPKLLWMKEHHPKIFAQINKVLLPKDYLRLLLSGDYASDMSDSAGTMWLNIAERKWDESLIKACGLSLSHMPALFEGSQITGFLLPELSKKWGMAKAIPIVAGGGDNAAGAIGAGLIEPGQGMLSLGTSGVYFVVSDQYSASPENAVHSFCHALPMRWHLMSVLLSAASCIQWFAESILEQDIGVLMASLESTEIEAFHCQDTPYFLPYLSGERTPHNNPVAKGMFFGLRHTTTKLHMLYAVLEGVSFAFADGVDALHGSGTKASEVSLIGGGAKSPFWRQMLADVLNLTMVYRTGGDVGPALGAARLAQIAYLQSVERVGANKPHNAPTLSDICYAPPIQQKHLANGTRHAHYQIRRGVFQRLYQQTKDLL
ncbi:xylulokinase [Glaciecola sp. SC05]|uniref:xylulokinase n=1 Tax=Glaciecola sp. SC05 TaxID=1987355 RepID=UPI003526E8F7